MDVSYLPLNDTTSQYSIPATITSHKMGGDTVYRIHSPTTYVINGYESVDIDAGMDIHVLPQYRAIHYPPSTVMSDMSLPMIKLYNNTKSVMMVRPGDVICEFIIVEIVDLPITYL